MSKKVSERHSIVSHAQLLQSIRCRLLLVTVVILFGFTVPQAWASSEASGLQPGADEPTTATPVWLEPRGLSVIELVGQVPDQYLKGMILSHGDMAGIVVYESGSRTGNKVVVTTTIYPRLTTPGWTPLLTSFGCLGQEPHYDHVGTVVPASVLRVYTSGGIEVTSAIRYMYTSHMDSLRPSANSNEPFRYPTASFGQGKMYPLPLQPGGLNIPTSSGCRIEIPGADHRRLTGVFTLELTPSVQAQVLGTQQASFKSYIGPGDVGIFSPLMEQMYSTYGHRWWRIPLGSPAGANYFLVRYPAMPGDPYTDRPLGRPYLNADRPTSGTYRLAKNTSNLSANLTVSAAFPLQRAWRDSDQASGSTFLPVMENPNQLEPPEYVLPADIAYNSCFVNGGCSRTILDQVYNQQMTLEIVYLSVAKPAWGGQWVPVKLVGPAWSVSASAEASLSSDAAALSTGSADTSVQMLDVPAYPHKAFMPFVALDEPDPIGCPCGWFDGTGRMLGFWP